MKNGLINHAESVGDVSFRFRIDSESFWPTFLKRIILQYGPYCMGRSDEKYNRLIKMTLNRFQTEKQTSPTDSA